MNVYKITGSPILHNGIRYGIGQTIELTENDATKIITFLQLVGKVDAPEMPPVLQAEKVQETPEIPNVDQDQPNTETPDDVEEETAVAEDHDDGNLEEAVVVDPPLIEEPPIVDEPIEVDMATEEASTEDFQSVDSDEPPIEGDHKFSLLTNEQYAVIEVDWTVAKLKELLDANSIDYPRSSTKRALMDLAWHLIQAVQAE